MAGPAYSDVNKRALEALAARKPAEQAVAQQAAELSPEDQAAAAVGATALAAQAQPEEPSTLEQVGTGAAATLLGLLPRIAGYATGGSEGLRLVEADEREQAARNEREGATARKMAAEMREAEQKMQVEREKLDAENEYRKQKLALEQMDASTKRMAALNDKKKEKEGKPTQFVAAGFAKRMELAEDTFKRLESKGFEAGSTLGRIASDWMPTALKSEDRKLQDQAERNFVNAVLRRESGAAISKEEFANAKAQYFPQAGDGPEVLAEKRANRELAVNALKAEAGNVYDKVASASRGTQGPAVPSDGSMMNTAVAKGPSVGDRAKAVGITNDQLAAFAKKNNLSEEQAIKAIERRAYGKK